MLVGGQIIICPSKSLVLRLKRMCYSRAKTIIGSAGRSTTVLRLGVLCKVHKVSKVSIIVEHRSVWVLQYLAF